MCSTSNMGNVQDTSVTRSGRLSLALTIGPPDVPTLELLIVKYAGEAGIELHGEDVYKLAEKLDGKTIYFLLGVA